MTEFQVLGTLRVGSGEGRELGGQVGRLLALLLLERAHPVSVPEIRRWVLAEPFLELNDRVHVLVARLRRELRQRELPAEIVTGGGGYRLVVDDAEVDAACFEQGVAGADDPGRLLSWWRGGVAAGLGLEDHPVAVRLEDLRQTVWEDAFEAELAAATFRRKLPEAVERCRARPDRERLVALTMTALYRSGRQTDALDLYRGVRQVLHDERGLEPGSGLRDVELAILRHDDAAIGGPDHPLRVRTDPSSKPLGNLPAAVSSFIGRAREVGELRDRLAEARIVTVVGVGGVGKTRVSLKVASTVQSAEMPDGVWWCELAPLGDPDAVPGVVAALFGLVTEAGRPLLDTLGGHLAGRTLLLVLDNCEHLVGRVAALVDGLCRRCPNLHVLATSREALRIDGEAVYPLRPLEPHEALALFTTRARAVLVGFEPDPASKAICEQLDGIPLALEMAAARLRSMQTDELAARLDERFRLLGGERRAEGRHHTLRAMVAWSDNLLSEDERQCFRRLAVFSGSFDLDAAQAVTGRHRDTYDLIDSLVLKSLVNAEPGPGRETRFTLLETVRHYALEQLDAVGEIDRSRRRHAEHYAGIVARAAVGLRGPEEPDWADLIDIELPNLRAAYSWALRVGDAALALAQFARLPCTSVSETTAFEMFDWIEPALALPGAHLIEARYPALLWLVTRSTNLQTFESIRPHLDRVLADERARERPEVLGLEATWIHAIKADLAVASQLHASAAAGFAARGDAYHSVRHMALSIWCRVEDEIADDIEELAPRARALQNPHMTAFGLGAPACAPRNVLRHPARALELLDEASVWAARSRNPFMHRAIAGARILALTLLGDPSALQAARRAITTSRNINQIGVPIGALSLALALRGYHDEAAQLIGAVSRSPTVYNTMVASSRVTTVWDSTRRTLGDSAFHSAVGAGAARDYDDLVAWLRVALDRLDLAAHP